MTARTMRPEPPQCSVEGCGLHAAARLSVMLPVTHTATKQADELELAMPLYVCEHHQANPRSTAQEMMALEHERLRIAVTALGYAEPLFEAARLSYDPLPPMPREGAH